MNIVATSLWDVCIFEDTHLDGLSRPGYGANS